MDDNTPVTFPSVSAQHTGRKLRWVRIAPTQSAIIRGWAYDRAARLLYVRFQRTDTYRFDGVPDTIVRSWLKAPSYGSYFHACIRTRFPYTLVHD